jgi:hypothetical protein
MAAFLPPPKRLAGNAEQLGQRAAAANDTQIVRRGAHAGRLPFRGRPCFFEAASSRSRRTFSSENSLVPFDSRAAATNSPRFSQPRIVSGARPTSRETDPINRGGAIGSGEVRSESESLRKFLAVILYAAKLE